MSSPTQSLAPTYTCRFCHRAFSLTGPVIIGETTESKMRRLAEILWKHTGEIHKKETGEMIVAGQNFYGWLMFRTWEHNDKFLQGEQDMLSEFVRGLLGPEPTVRTIHVSDEEIEQQVNHVIHAQGIGDQNPDRNETRKTVIALLKSMRNTFEGPPPQKPPAGGTPK